MKENEHYLKISRPEWIYMIYKQLWEGGTKLSEPNGYEAKDEVLFLSGKYVQRFHDFVRPNGAVRKPSVGGYGKTIIVNQGRIMKIFPMNACLSNRALARKSKENAVLANGTSECHISSNLHLFFVQSR